MPLFSATRAISLARRRHILINNVKYSTSSPNLDSAKSYYKSTDWPNKCFFYISAVKQPIFIVPLLHSLLQLSYDVANRNLDTLCCFHLLISRLSLTAPQQKDKDNNNFVMHCLISQEADETFNENLIRLC